MNNAGENIRKSLQKRQEALDRFRVLQNNFLMTRQQILREIEEARTIWEKTKKQLPNQGFDQ